jgi:hypothetical protein
MDVVWNVPRINVSAGLSLPEFNWTSAGHAISRCLTIRIALASSDFIKTSSRHHQGIYT